MEVSTFVISCKVAAWPPDEELFVTVCNCASNNSSCLPNVELDSRKFDVVGTTPTSVWSAWWFEFATARLSATDLICASNFTSASFIDVAELI